MSDLKNIETFHTVISVVLDRLYANFPNPIEIDPFFIEGNNGSRVLYNLDDENEFCDANPGTYLDNEIRDELTIYDNSILFLIEEGYMKCSNPKRTDDKRIFRSCVLTSKGLGALGKVGVKNKVNWGQLLHTAIRDGKYKAIKDIAMNILG